VRRYHFLGWGALWVEGFFELFATVLVAIMFRQIGLVTARTATRLVFLDAVHCRLGERPSVEATRERSLARAARRTP
jgi:hypothetical protein